MTETVNHKLTAVCMLVTNMDAPTGGIQKNSRLLLKEFARRGITTYVCVRNYYGLQKDETDGLTSIHRSRVVGQSIAVNGILYLADTFWWLVRNRKKYDVIHCQQMFGPTIVATVASFFLNKPIVTRVTTSGEFGEAKFVREMPPVAIRMMLIRRVSHWIALTREMKSELETLEIPPERIKIIHNSTEIPDTTAYHSRSRMAMRRVLGLDHGKVVVFVGRLSEEKNLDVLIDAWVKVVERYPNTHLFLIGEGGNFRNVEADLTEQTRRLGLEGTVHFMGHVDNAKDYVLASDAFVLPTRTEGMSNALVEAFACGASIIATDIPANTEICQNEVNSLTVPVGDSLAIEDAIVRFFDDPQLAEKLGKNARRKAETELSIDNMVDSYLDIYRDALRDTR